MQGPDDPAWFVLTRPLARLAATAHPLMSPRFLADAGVLAPVVPSVQLREGTGRRLALLVGTRPYATVLPATRDQVLAIASTAWCDNTTAERWCATTPAAAKLALEVASVVAGLHERWSDRLSNTEVATSVSFGTLLTPSPRPAARTWLGFAEALSTAPPGDLDQAAEISRVLVRSWGGDPTELAAAVCALTR